MRSQLWEISTLKNKNDLDLKADVSHFRYSEVDDVSFGQIWNMLLLFSGVMLSIRSFLLSAVRKRLSLSLVCPFGIGTFASQKGVRNSCGNAFLRC